MGANVEFSPACPRCGSSNTKFCYYNNYSLTQPRFFCKGCRRYWTRGGSLRNVPVGGGCRRSRRGRSLRVSPHDDHVSSRNLSSYGSESSNGTSAVPDGSNIDLAVVYANFLNQTPQTQPHVEREMPPALVLSSVPDMAMEFGIHLPQENDLVQQYFASSTTDCATSDYGLLPLPPAQEMVWSNPDVIVPNHMLHVLRPEAQDRNELVGDGSPFGLPDYVKIFRV
ncbi:hypothetical protein RJ640_003625 [Escallonia rubra]|uniref:Dof zinc finger protein n=1 Tax=Escallonia rubra TaxID=112253 RepID=A0AA88U1W6_9ASTE|nr:hypothetical protein RJ640_003625 [Escallonia rubra]